MPRPDDFSFIEFDHRANMVYIDIQRTGTWGSVVRTEHVGPSLLANYDADGQLVSVEVLSIAALRRPETLELLETLLPPAVMLDVRLWNMTEPGPYGY